MGWLTRQKTSSGGSEKRRKAIEDLGADPSPGAIKSLRKALDDEDEEVRRLAAAALGRMDDERCVEPLLLALKDHDPEVVRTAAAGLKATRGDDVTAALVPLLRHNNAAVRSQVAQTLESVAWRPPTAPDEMWYLIARGKFLSVSQFGLAAIPALETILEGDNSNASVGAVKALGAIEDKESIRPLLAALRSPDGAVCAAAVEAVARMRRPETIEALVGVLRHPATQARLAAIEGVAGFGPTAPKEPVRELLKDPQWEVRKATAEILGRIRDSGAVQALSEALSDSDADVREAVVTAMGNVRDRNGIAPLVHALKDSNSTVRRAVATSLSRIDNNWSTSNEARVAIEQLKATLQSADPDARHFIGQILKDLVSSKSAPAPPPAPRTPSIPEEKPSGISLENRLKMAMTLFLSIIGDRDRDLRLAAAEALGRIADRRAEPALKRALSDSDATVRRAAEHSIGTLRGK